MAKMVRPGPQIVTVEELCFLFKTMTALEAHTADQTPADGCDRHDTETSPSQDSPPLTRPDHG